MSPINGQRIRKLIFSACQILSPFSLCRIQIKALRVLRRSLLTYWESLNRAAKVLDHPP